MSSPIPTRRMPLKRVPAKAQRLIAITLLALAAHSPVHAEIYRTTDANGNVIFTDQRPITGNIEAIDLPSVTIFPSIEPKKSYKANSDKASKKKKIENPYISLKITSPGNDETLINPEVMAVEVESSPAIQEGDTFCLLVDGLVVQTSHEPKLSVSWPDRGSHTLQVQIVNRDGEVLKKSSAQTVYVQQAIKGVKRKSGNGN